ncbi:MULTISPECIES: hypothetical protein [Brevibacillus]|uniref:hypothetical protein n=1 Tax=Brevibacillus TaxID=55080 RepID=UPI0019D505DE|nr:hypothetical protein [Brevibacillus agri]
MKEAKIEDKLLKLYEKQEKLTERKEKIDEQLRKVNKQIKELEHEQQAKTIEETMVVVNKRGLDLKLVLQAIESGQLDHILKSENSDSEEKQEGQAQGGQAEGQ